MKMKIIYVITLAIIMSGCLVGEDTTNNIQISDSEAQSLPTSSEGINRTTSVEETNGKVVIWADPGYQNSDVEIRIREWHIDERNVTCWSFTEMNYRGMAVYSGFSCIPDDQL